MRTLKIINLTPHEVVIQPSINKPPLVTFPPSGEIARCIYKTHVEERIRDAESGVVISLTHTRYTEVNGLPDPQPYTLYIVSDIVAKQMAHIRDDLRITNGLLRDENGRVIACKTLGRIDINPY